MILSVVIFSFFLSACGNAGEDEDSAELDTELEQVEQAKAEVIAFKDKTMYKPAMFGDSFIHLSDGAEEFSIQKQSVVKIFLNNGIVGWHSLDPLKEGTDLAWDGSADPTFTIYGQPLSMTFGSNFTFLLDDGRELSQITSSESLDVIAGEGMFVEVKQDGLIYGYQIIPDFFQFSKTIINLNTTNGEVEIKPVVANGFLINLVDSNPIEKVLDVDSEVIAGYRIAWNRFGSWYPAGGKISALQLPKTIIQQATMPIGLGADMPYLVKPNGDYIPYNTYNCKFFVDGVEISASPDGLFHY